MASTVTREQAEELQKKLTKLTTSDALRWRRSDARPGLPGTDGHLGRLLAWEVTYQDVPLYLAQYAARAYDGERDEYYWQDEQSLALLDPESGLVLEVLPSTGALDDLIAAVRAQVHKVPDLINKMLKPKAD